MKKYQGLLILLSVFLLSFTLLAGCKSQPAAEDTTPAPESAPAAAAQPAPEPSPQYQGPPEEGIYVGIISFAADAWDLTGTPVFLDEDGRDALLDIIDTDYNRADEPGTALYYAVHKAIAGLSANSGAYPIDILSANVVTFTDGLDTSSTFLRLPAIEGERFKTDGDYRAYLREQIAGRKVNNANITAFSSGVKSYDVVDNNLFTQSLQSIASEGNSDVLDNFDKLRDTFEGIADQVEVTLTRATGILSLTGFQPGTVIRVTFDIPSEDGAPSPSMVANSRFWAEGTLDLNASGDGYVFRNITYSGVVSSTVDSIPGTIRGNVIDFVFDNIEFLGGRPEQVLQWYRNTDTGNAWQFNTEYLADQDIQFYVVKKTVVIYLVLDASTSLSNDDVDSIRDASKAFIEALYEKVAP